MNEKNVTNLLILLSVLCAVFLSYFNFFDFNKILNESIVFIYLGNDEKNSFTNSNWRHTL
jgi:hypothetical protein